MGYPRAPAARRRLQRICFDVITRYELDAFFTREPDRAPAVRQMMVATILCLYRGEADKLWLARTPSTWHAADAVAALADGGALRDWGRLVALYPGW